MMAAMIQAAHVLIKGKSEREAKKLLRFHKKQKGFIGGKIMFLPWGSNPNWAVQVFGDRDWFSENVGSNYIPKVGITLTSRLRLKECGITKKRADELMTKMNEEQELPKWRRKDLVAKGKRIAKQLGFEDAKALIVAEFENFDWDDDSLAERDGELVVLAASKHTQSLFPELREAAKRFSETEELADASKDVELLVDYSEYGPEHGIVNSLKDGFTSTGWRVHKILDRDEDGWSNDVYSRLAERRCL